MNIFLSYSSHDAGLTRTVYDYLSGHAKVFCWDADKAIGTESWSQIFEEIERADVILVLVTKGALNRAFAIGQEVGHAKSKGKPIIPLVAPGVSSSELGFLAGITYQILDPGNPGPALRIVEQRLAKTEAAWAKNALLLTAGIAAIIWLASQD